MSTRSLQTSNRAVDLGALADHGLLFLIFVAAAGSFFKLGLATPVWGVIYLGVLLALLRDGDGILRALPRSWLMLCFPLVCLASTVWSVEPVASFKNAVQYLFTAVIAYWIGTHFPLANIFKVLCVALLLCVLVSVVGGKAGLFEAYEQGDYVGAEQYFVGMYMQKNIMGITVVYAAIATLVVGVLIDKKILLGAIAAALLPVLVMTKSTTALLLYVLAMSYYVVWYFFARVTYRVPVLLAGIVVLLALSFYLLLTDAAVISEFLGLLGKDATLTGRTEIWANGHDVFVQHPFLGVGYQAFWLSPIYANEVMLIRAAVLETIGGFHSGYLESAVGTGLLGLSAYVLMLLTALSVAVRYTSLQDSALSIGGLFVIGLIFSRTFTESAAYFQHDLEFIMLLALVVALQRLKRERDGAVPR